MILVDSSVWIDYFNGRRCPETDRLDNLLARELVLTGDLILAEVLQGFRTERGYRTAAALMSRLLYADLAGREVAIAAAGNYRRLRAAGVTVRKTIDVIIATFCLRHQVSILYTDRDLDPMVRHLGLRVA